MASALFHNLVAFPAPHITFYLLGSLVLIITHQDYALLGVSTAYFRDEIQDQSLIFPCIIFHKAITHSQFSGKDAMKKHGIGNTIPITVLENYPIPVELTLSALSILIVQENGEEGVEASTFNKDTRKETYLNNQK